MGLISGGGGGSGGGSGTPNDGWVDDTADTWTYASANPPTFTITGDETAVLTPGTRIKLTQTTVKYFVVTAVSVSSGTTTVTIFAGSDYTLANAAISANYHSYVVNPQGYPGKFTYNNNPTGFSGTPTQRNSVFSVVGRVCTVYIDTFGTSNATSFTIDIPIAPSLTNQLFGPTYGVNNGASIITVLAQNLSGATLTCYPTSAFGAWTNTGTKQITLTASYYI